MKENPFLKFKTVISTETGELSRFLHAYYKGLLFTIIEANEKYPIPKVTVEGRNERVASFFNNRKKTNISQPQHNTQHYGGK